MTTYKLIALDLDGTTLNNNHEISLRTLDCLRAISENSDVIVAIATGRSINSILPYVDQLQIKRSIPVICFNGSIGFSALPFGDPEPLFSQPIDEDLTIELLDFAARHSYVAQVGENNS